MIQHISMLPQFEKQARSQALALDEKTALPVLMELLSQIDEKLEHQAEKLNSNSNLIKRLGGKVTIAATEEEK